MCIVVDINTLSMVFNQENEFHSEFYPVKNWIESGKGVLVFGGTTYKKELKKTIKYLKLVRLLKDSGQAISIKDKEVDDREKIVKELLGSGTDCDDPHLIALLGASRCPLICSKDKRSYPFIRNKSLYPKKAVRVKIYSSSKNVDLLSNISLDCLMNVES